MGQATDSSAQHPIRVAVVLGDPRLPYSYNLSQRFEAGDYEAVDRLMAALAELPGYTFEYLDDHAALHAALPRCNARLVLNFCNTGHGNRVSRQLHVPALLEMLDIAYVGAGPECMALCHDKAMVLDAAAGLGVPVPRQQYLRLSPESIPEAREYPALLKPNFGDGSIGMEADAVVRDQDDMARCVRRLTDEFDRPAVLIQQYLPGAEYSVGVIGNPGTGFTCLPPLEIDFSGLDADLPPILTHASKVDPASRYWRAVQLRPAALSDSARERLHGHCCQVFERLGCRDYARFDFRCDALGEPHLIDVNAHPMWGAGGMMATMAAFAGYGYADMLGLYLEAARARLAGDG